MHHYVYCIENLVNGKIYVGKHSTEDLDDGYMGSGKLVKHAIAKHGLENFRRHILKDDFNSSEEALEFEKLLVNEEFVSDENTYNLTCGGSGGNFSREDNHRGGVNAMLKNWSNPIFRELSRNSVIIANKSRRGCFHKIESKIAIGKANAIAQKGEKNSQFGTCWISHSELKKNKKVNKDEVEGYLVDGWVKGRKMKW